MDWTHCRLGWAVVLVMGVVVAASSPPAASAATLVVNTTQDDTTAGNGLCSLREAISEVDAPGTASDCGLADVGGPNTIMLGAQTYTLTVAPAGTDDNATGDLDIVGSVKGLTIAGAGTATVIDASGMVAHNTGTGDRVLSVAVGAGVTLSDLTLRGGRLATGTAGTTGTPAGGDGADGGGINNAGSLNLEGVTVTDNRAGAGGAGVTVMSGTNGAGGTGGSGGGIYSTGTLQLVGSTVSGNQSGRGGGGGGFPLPMDATNGGLGGTGGAGGGIDSSGASVLTNSTISGNSAGGGGSGGLAGSGSGGGAGDGGDGGGVYTTGDGTLTGSSVTSDSAGSGGSGGPSGMSTGGKGGAGGQGGGVYSTATFGVTGSQLRQDLGGAGGSGGSSMQSGGQGGTGGAGGDGGGIQTIGMAAALTVVASTLANDAAGKGGVSGGSFGTGGNGGSGGGVSDVDGSLAVTNSTIAANAAGNGGQAGDLAQISGFGAGGSGGGVRAMAPTSSTLQSVTIADNTAGVGASGGMGHAGGNGSGGGVFQPNPLCVVGQPCISTQLEDSIVASASPGAAVAAGGNCSGRVTDGGHNLNFGDTSCPAVSNGDPLLGTLQDNGGGAPTMALGPGSAGIDGVPSTGAGCPASDERGVLRPGGAACDIGAYEVAAPAATTGAASSITTEGATISAIVTANAGPANGGAAVHFDFGLTTAYGSQTAIQNVTGVTSTTLTAALSGLTANTTYHYRVVAASVDGSTVSPDATFTTAAPPVGPNAGGSGGGTGAGTGGASSGSGGSAGIGGSSSGGSAGGGSSSGGSAGGSTGGATGGPGGSGSGGGVAASAPVLGALTLSRTAFTPARSGASVARAAPTGTDVRYRDSRAATTTFSVLRAQAGVVTTGRCVAPPRSAPRKPPRRCTHFVAVGGFVHSDVAGANALHFTGRIAGHKLGPGSYRLTATPRAGGLTGSSRSVAFRVLA